MKKERLTLVILVALLLLALLFTDTWILFRETHNQTRQAGLSQLQSVSWELQSSISDAEGLTMELAIKAREYLDDKKALEKFIYAEKEKRLSSQNR